MKSIIQFSNDQFASCDRMPVNTPGNNQPFGALAVYEMKTRNILLMSSNFHKFVPARKKDSDAKTLEDWLPKEIFEEVVRLESSRREVSLVLPKEWVVSEKGATWMTLHRHGNRYILEFEFDPADAKESISPGKMQQLLGELLLLSEENFFPAVLDTIQGFMPFDRMMIYKFDEQWNGQVIAERKESGVASYLNHWFPEGDIPKPARDMYLVNPARVICDISASSVEILAAANAPTTPMDLSSCVSRGVMPVHAEYLRNMGVEASSSFAILVRGKLWGILACHNLTPRYVSPDVRAWTLMVLRTVALKISELELLASGEKSAARKRMIHRISEQVQLDGPTFKGLSAIGHAMLDVADAHGVAFIEGGRVHSHGQTPNESWILKVAELARARFEDRVFRCESLAERLEDYRLSGSDTAGVLAVSVDKKSNSMLLWFRNSLVREILWGGDPRKPKERESYSGRIHPRKSFETWKQSLFFHSSPWTEMDMLSARDCGLLFSHS